MLPFLRRANVVGSRSLSSSPSHNGLQLSELPNGVRVASHQLPYGGSSFIGVFVQGGSRYETPEFSGCSFLLDRLAFGATSNRTAYGFNRELQSVGAQPRTSTSREHAMLGVEVLPSFADYAMELLAESIQSPVYDPLEVHDLVELAVHNISQPESFETKVTDLFLRAAFGNSSLGNPVLPTPETLSKIDVNTLANYSKKLYAPNRLVVVATGLDHDNVKEIAERHFGHLHKSVESFTKTPSTYTGGQAQSSEGDKDGYTHFVLGFDAGQLSDQELVTLFTLNTLLGGGSSFSSGGPGKGLFSRLYSNILNKHHYVHGAQSLCLPHSDANIFGMYGITTSNQVENLARILANEFTGIIKNKPSSHELDRSKNMFKAALHMTLESRGVLFEDIGSQLATYGRYLDLSACSSMVDKVTTNDVVALTEKLLKSTPTVVVSGDAERIPRVDKLLSL